MVDKIKAGNLGSVIEIGSGGLGIGPYLKSRFIGIDVAFTQPYSSHLKPIVGSALSVPIKDSSSQVAISSDMLEHVPAKQRVKAVTELFRIATHMIIIGVPTGSKAHQQDKDLDTEYQKVHGDRHPFLEEQTTFGLPAVADIEKAIADAARATGKSYSVEIVPNINLKLRLWMMRGWISRSLIANIFYRKFLLFFIPLFRHFNQKPVYRHLFFITLNPVTT